MATADLDASGFGRNQGEADAELLFVTEKMLWIVCLEGDT